MVPQTPAATPAASTLAQSKNETVPSERKGLPAAPKALAAGFSRAGEDYGAGVVEKGNTEMEVGAATFRIQTVNAYPESYDGCTAIAKQERDSDAKPELAPAGATLINE